MTYCWKLMVWFWIFKPNSFFFCFALLCSKGHVGRILLYDNMTWQFFWCFSLCGVCVCRCRVNCNNLNKIKNDQEWSRENEWCLKGEIRFYWNNNNDFFFLDWIENDDIIKSIPSFLSWLLCNCEITLKFITVTS